MKWRHVRSVGENCGRGVGWDGRGVSQWLRGDSGNGRQAGAGGLHARVVAGAVGGGYVSAAPVRAAGTGALSISVGSSPMFTLVTTRARGARPWALAYSGLASSTAAAPSTTPEEFPA